MNHPQRLALVFALFVVGCQTLPDTDQPTVGERWTPELVAQQSTDPERTWLTGGRELTESELVLVELMESSHIPGLSAAVVKDGVLLWSSALGWADPERGIPVDEGTLFQLASISKTVTATVAMQLVEAGVLDLDADLDELLPFSVRHPEFPDVALTLRMLLTHTAGLRDNWNVLEGTWVKDGDFHLSLRDSIAAYFTPAGEYYTKDKNFQDWAPGTKGSYANVGFALLAFAAEVASGRSFEELVREGVLGPLDIEGGFRLAEVDQERVAVPQRWNREGGFEGLGHHGYLDFASGTLRTSALGLARFLAANQLGGELDGARILNEATVADMLRVQLPDIDEEQGLAWYQDEIGGQLFWGHDGGDPGVATQMYFRPSDGIGFVLLLNGSPRGRGAERKLVGALLGIGEAATTRRSIP